MPYHLYEVLKPTKESYLIFRDILIQMNQSLEMVQEWYITPSQEGGYFSLGAGAKLKMSL